MTALASWLLAAALHYAPASCHVYAPGSHVEAEHERATRYASIAEDIAIVATSGDPVEGFTREQSAALLLALAVGESCLSPDIDAGRCYVPPGSTRCDSGRSVSIFQILARRWKGERFTSAQLRDRRFAARVALAMVRASHATCRAWPMRYRLSAYGQGRCGPLEAAASRHDLFVSMLVRQGDPTQ